MKRTIRDNGFAEIRYERVSKESRIDQITTDDTFFLNDQSDVTTDNKKSQDPSPLPSSPSSPVPSSDYDDNNGGYCPKSPSYPPPSITDGTDYKYNGGYSPKSPSYPPPIICAIPEIKNVTNDVCHEKLEHLIGKLKFVKFVTTANDNNDNSHDDNISDISYRKNNKNRECNIYGKDLKHVAYMNPELANRYVPDHCYERENYITLTPVKENNDFQDDDDESTSNTNDNESCVSTSFANSVIGGNSNGSFDNCKKSNSRSLADGNNINSSLSSTSTSSSLSSTFSSLKCKPSRYRAAVNFINGENDKNTFLAGTNVTNGLENSFAPKRVIKIKDEHCGNRTFKHTPTFRRYHQYEIKFSDIVDVCDKCYFYNCVCRV